MRPSHFYTFGFVTSRDFCVNITRYLVFESHTHQPSIFTVGMNSRRIILISRRFYLQPSLLVINIRRPSLLSATSSPLSPVHSDGGGSAPNDGHLCLLYTSLLVDKHPPSIFTLRDFVAAFAGLLPRRVVRHSIIY
jgi:hypothetical protein